MKHLTGQDGAYQCYERWPPIAYAGYSFRIYHIPDPSQVLAHAD